MNQANFQCFTAFVGEQRLASGPLAEVAIAVLKASKTTPAQPIIIFDDAIGRPIDLDLRGTGGMSLPVCRNPRRFAGRDR